MTSLRSIFRFSKPRRGAWACIIIALAIVAIWSASLGASVYTGLHTLGVGIHSGSLIFVSFDEPPALMHGAHWIWPNLGAIWLPEWERNATNTHLTIPLYPLMLALLAYGLFRLYRTRPIPAHLCTICRYDRRGIPASAPCPECGTQPHSAGTTT